MGSDVYTPPQDAIVRLKRDGYSYRQIAAYLDRKGVQPAKAAKWSAMSVRNIYERSEATRRG